MTQLFTKQLSSIVYKLLPFLFIIVIGHLLFSIYKISISSAPDFSIYFNVIHDLLANKNPYTNTHLYTLFAYPLATAILFTPLILLPYQTAQFLFILLSFGIGLFTPFLILKILNLQKGITSPDYRVISILFLLSFPFKFTLGMGQVNLFAYFFLISSLYFLLKNQIFFPALLYAIALLLKPIFIYFVLYYVLYKKYKFLVYLFLTMNIFLIASFILFGVSYNLYYFTHILPSLFSTSGRNIYYNQGFMGFISRLAFTPTTISFLSILFLISITISIILLKQKLKLDQNYCFGLFLCALLLIDSLSWQHHFVFLLFPFCLAYQYTRTRFMFIALILSYILVSIHITNPEALSNTSFALILSHTFYGGLLLFLVLVLNANVYKSFRDAL